MIHLTGTEFVIGDICVPVYDSDLADALKQLSITQREIILRSYFLQQTDQEIASSMKLTRKK